MEKIETKEYVKLYAPDWFIERWVLWDRLSWATVDRMKLSRYLYDNNLMQTNWVKLYDLNERGKDNWVKFIHSPHYNKDNG